MISSLGPELPSTAQVLQIQTLVSALHIALVDVYKLWSMLFMTYAPSTGKKSGGNIAQLSILDVCQCHTVQLIRWSSDNLRCITVV